MNTQLEGKYFGSFIYFSENGVFLRMFKIKKSWIKTRLVPLDFNSEKLSVIKKTNSSWNVWYGIDLGNGKHSIKIKPTKKIEYQIY